jgi:predicted lipid-binding transport protein (Tim44 family)
MGVQSVFSTGVSRHRSAVLATAVALFGVLVTPSTAFALGGGGVGGYGGGGGGFGGGGGGGGFGGSGRGFGGGGFREASGGGGAAGLVILALIAFFGLYILLGSGLHARRSRRAVVREPFSIGRTIRHVVLWPLDLIMEWRRLRPRKETVRLAAAEASEEDPRFAPDVVCAQAEQLFRAIQSAWTKDDRAALARLVGTDLMVEWERRLTAFALRGWENRVDIHGPVHADYVGLRNGPDDRSKRACVRLTARVRDVVIDKRGETIHRVNSMRDTHHVCEYWTLGLSGDHWILVSIEQHHEGLHELTEPLLPTPWSDTKELRRQATVEQAAATRVENSQVGEIATATLSTGARAAALDISLVDDRFAPRVLEAEVDYAVGVWCEAIDGDDAQLDAVASSSAAQDLLYPGDETRRRRLVLRGARVRSAEIVELEAHAAPPSMTVELHVRGVRYVEDRTTTTVMGGDKSVEHAFTMRWRMELTDSDEHPWRIAGVDSGMPALQ